jgi:uncharacterized protein with beta-barrel porin domain
MAGGGAVDAGGDTVLGGSVPDAFGGSGFVTDFGSSTLRAGKTTGAGGAAVPGSDGTTFTGDGSAGVFSGSGDTGVFSGFSGSGSPGDMETSGRSRLDAPEAGEWNIRTPMAVSPAAKITIPVNKAKNNPSRRVNFARLRFLFFTIRRFLGSSSGFLTVLFTPLRIAFIRNLGQWRLFQKLKF